ncbi:peptide chain release factor 3 [bacterium]|nr:peptide chain release factor 3 [bacterium]
MYTFRLRLHLKKETMTNDRSQIQGELEKRRTFAVISHPDAGKTTLTEKLLLYAGMIRTAGMVHARKQQKSTSSDWMQMEQERGISITASAMQFVYKDVVINVLDTPGHQDFSEDTYRTLTAADSAVMVIDAGKGVEPQTRKLFRVCSMRGIPILTFINKLDLPGREPLDLLSELEEALGIRSAPLFWPIGQGEDFQGVYDLRKDRVLLFTRSEHGGAAAAHMEVCSKAELKDRKDLEPETLEQFEESLELIQEAGNPFTTEEFLAGKLTPVFFGSALINFGIEPFFDAFAELAPYPSKRKVLISKNEESAIDPAEEPFSGYVFKVQANMDLKHRDSMAFLRVCSGKFERDLVVKHESHQEEQLRKGQTKKDIRLSRSHNMFGGERQTVDAAYPGDIVGVVNPGVFAIGDTVSLRGGYHYPPLPKFPPEVVCRLRPTDALKRKAFEKGMKQFRNEGAVLILETLSTTVQGPLVAAVGPLQFEVLQFRLESEYGVKTERETMSYRHGVWLIGDIDGFDKPSGALLAEDRDGQRIMLYTSAWEKDHAAERNPNVTFAEFLSL